jgi:ABC-type dipeptide/oligopeptide/nickel transport system permease subunit
MVAGIAARDFISAARIAGVSRPRILVRHVLPNIAEPLVVNATIGAGGALLSFAGLSFLGLGIPAPTASWGNLLAEGPNYYLTQPWLMVWPGLAILLTTLAFNLLGDGLRDAFDPRRAH